MESIERNKKGLIDVIRGLTRLSPIPGMEGEAVPDPIAEYLVSKKSALKSVESYLHEKGFYDLTPLKDGYGMSAVLLDAGDNVIRLSGMYPTAKPEHRRVLKPSHSEIIDGISVVISKKLQTDAITDNDVAMVQKEFANDGYTWDDAGRDNLGKDDAGNLFVIDGSVRRVS